ncbi:MAG TPA: RidA family protein [Propionibacterium sp.]|jgi:2-iminobutanoate/2-iminopropanoate deaminase|nr:RidA family protein [Propionibacterium sp.]
MTKATPRVITTDKAPTTGFSEGTKAPLSMAIAHNGFLFVSGQGPLDPKTHTIVSDDFEEQTRTTLENLLRVVEAAGSTKNDILRCNVYIRDMENFPKFNPIYREFFSDASHFPARTTVRADAPRAGVLVEIDCIAAVAE